jgi:hypothetical protein
MLAHRLNSVLLRSKTKLPGKKTQQMKVPWWYAEIWIAINPTLFQHGHEEISAGLLVVPHLLPNQRLLNTAPVFC